MSGHWINNSIDDFLFVVVFDFINEIKSFMASDKVSRSELAKRLNVSKGRVNQILSCDRNITLKTLLKVGL